MPTLLPRKFLNFHDDVIKWKQFPRHWPFVRAIRRLAVDLHPYPSPPPPPPPLQRPATWRFDVIFDLRLNQRLSKHPRDAGDMRRHRVHRDVTLMWSWCLRLCNSPLFQEFTKVNSLYLSKTDWCIDAGFHMYYRFCELSIWNYTLLFFLKHMQFSEAFWKLTSNKLLHIWGVLCHEQVSGAVTSNYISQYICGM